MRYTPRSVNLHDGPVANAWDIFKPDSAPLWRSLDEEIQDTFAKALAALPDVVLRSHRGG